MGVSNHFNSQTYTANYSQHGSHCSGLLQDVVSSRIFTLAYLIRVKGRMNDWRKWNERSWVTKVPNLATESSGGFKNKISH